MEEKPIKPAEFVEAVKKVYDADDFDKEYGHIETDELMEKILIQLGYGEGVKLIHTKERWYS